MVRKPRVYRRLRDNPSRGFVPVGVICDLARQAHDRHVEPAWYLGPPEIADRIADQRRAYWGIVVVSDTDDLSSILDRHAAAIPHILVVRKAREDSRNWHGARDCGGLAVSRFDERLLLPVPRAIKRVLDLSLSLVGCLLAAPLFAVIALAILATSPGPVFYSQLRVGRGGKMFRAWKFRSMVPNAEEVLEQYLSHNPSQCLEWEKFQKLRRDPRVMTVGRLLRKTSLDELPQLWNVVRGEMSLVGPRPITPAQIHDYPLFHLYVRLTPGITGLWQINGRNLTTFRRRTELDAAYIRNWSPLLDLSILARTIRVVLHCEGAY